MNLIWLPIRLSRPVSLHSKACASVCTTRMRHQRRYKSDNASAPPITADEISPILKDYYAKRPAELQDIITGQSQKRPADVKFGDMPKESIFGKEDSAKPLKKEKLPERDPADRKKLELTEADRVEFQDDRSLDVLNRVLDPFPHKRWEFERQQIIKDARRGWRLTKSEYLRRTERRSALNSMPLKTSRKKLGALARQIAGKSVDEALLQMRFSKKRSAIEVINHLEEARDHAIVRWGMGLGQVEDRQGEPVSIKLNNGTKRHVTDRTAMYIEHAMVRSHKPSVLPEYRARGRMNMIMRKWTSLRIILREEHTRIRESQEREERKARRAPFVPLPDKPITQQRQYVLW